MTQVTQQVLDKPPREEHNQVMESNSLKEAMRVIDNFFANSPHPEVDVTLADPLESLTQSERDRIDTLLDEAGV